MHRFSAAANLGGQIYAEMHTPPQVALLACISDVLATIVNDRSLFLDGQSDSSQASDRSHRPETSNRVAECGSTARWARVQRRGG